MPIVKIDQTNTIYALTKDDGKQVAMTKTELKHYHNKIVISSHFNVIDNELVEFGELMTVFKFNRQHKIVKSLITSC